ncbi:MAG: ABC transporter permease, partial [Nitrospira sp.]|nr:ABC transporter permease [Nitrospira sp.]
MSTFVWLTVVTALRILQRNRLRAGLTMLGIIIGVGAVIAMVSIGEGAKLAVQKQIASMGANSILIWPNYSVISG